MWEQWNDALHESIQNWEAILEPDINDKIKQTVAIRPGQLARIDIGLVAHSLKHHLGQLLHTKKLWLESIEAVANSDLAPEWVIKYTNN